MGRGWDFIKNRFETEKGEWSWTSLLEPLFYLGAGLVNGLTISVLSSFGENSNIAFVKTLLDVRGAPGFVMRLIPLTLDGTAGFLVGQMFLKFVCSQCYIAWNF